MIAATQMQILQSLFQHALQFIPEQSDPVDFFEMYFDETQIKKANGEAYSKSNGNTSQNLQENNDQFMQNTLSSNLGKTRFTNQSKSSAGFPNKDQNLFQGNGGISQIRSKQDFNEPQSQQQQQQQGFGQVKKITVKKMQGSQSQTSAHMNEKEFKQDWKTKLSPIKKPNMQIIKMSRNNPFNQQKDGFFHQHHPTTAQSSQSYAYPSQNGTNGISQTNTMYNNINGGISNKNLRSNSNQNNKEVINGVGSSNNIQYQKQNQSYNNNNLDQSHHNPRHQTESQVHNQSQYSVYDAGLKYNPNPYAAGWANAILKEHYKVALKQRIDEKNGRKRWIIRKIKMQKDGDQHLSGLQTNEDSIKVGGSIVAGILPHHHAALIKPDNKLKKQVKKSDHLEDITDLFTKAFVIKQREAINSSQPDLLEFSELFETLSFDREYIAYNLLNQPINQKLQNINEEEFEEKLQPYYEYVSQNIFCLQLYHLNFKSHLERIIFLNKLLIGNL